MVVACVYDGADIAGSVLVGEFLFQYDMRQTVCVIVCRMSYFF